MRIYLDDTRKCPDGWTLARTVEEAKMLLALGASHLSLDYDLGYDQPTGLDLCRWMAQTGNWPSEMIEIHSSHPLGRLRMRHFLKERAPREYGL